MSISFGRLFAIRMVKLIPHICLKRELMELVDASLAISATKKEHLVLIERS